MMGPRDVSYVVSQMLRPLISLDPFTDDYYYHHYNARAAHRERERLAELAAAADDDAVAVGTNGLVAYLAHRSMESGSPYMSPITALLALPSINSYASKRTDRTGTSVLADV